MSTVIHQLDNTYYMLNGKKHRKDGPAVISPYQEEWWVDGERHREDGPAIISLNGSLSYYVKGKLHREDGPAVVLSNGLQEWWLNGRKHRVDGPAYIFGNMSEWWVNGELHRVDGPAILTPTTTAWYEKGRLHRLDGPAMMYHLSNVSVWYIEGVRYNTEEEFLNAKKKLKDGITDLLYHDMKMCKDVAKYISCFVY